MQYDQLLSHFKIAKQRGDKAQANCPAHSDKHASLSIALSGDRILIYCHAGCSVDEVLLAAGLKLADLFIGDRQPPTAIYQYRKADGSLSHEKLKYQDKSGKTFRQRRLVNGQLVDNIDGLTHIPYNLPAVMAAIKAKQTILYTEGEKDANTARILGFTATTMGGAGDWKDEYKRYFNKAMLVQIPDKDSAGLKLAGNITKSLTPVCNSLKVVILPEGKDLTEWVSEGNSRKELDVLLRQSPELSNHQDRTFDWREHLISLTDLKAKEFLPLEFLVKDLLVTPGLGILAAPKKRGKSWLALQLSHNVSAGTPFLGIETRQGSTVHMALEDGERRMRQRIELQNIDANLPIQFISRFEPLNTTAGQTAFREMIRELRPALAVVDTLAAAKSRKLDENEAGANADLFNWFHALSLEENLFILVIAHHGKMSTGDAGFDIRGSSAIPGATDVNIGLYKNEDGSCDLKAEGRDIGEIELTIKFDAEQTWAWQLKGDARELRKEASDNRIIDALENFGGEADIYDLAEAIGTTRQTIHPQLGRLIDSGVINTSIGRKGNKQIILYKLIHMYNNNTDITTTPSLTTLPTHISPVGNDGKQIYIPDFPTEPCSVCKGSDFYLNKDDKWMCQSCHPEPLKGGKPKDE
jgi:hypothetical protein